MVGPPMREVIGNPMLELYERWSAGDSVDGPDDWLPRFGFAVPHNEALDLIAANAPGGIVEVGAGTGYWARMLSEHGIDVVAYDIAPPPHPSNQWFAGRQPWFPVAYGDAASVAAANPERTLLLVWPTRNEDWAADAAMAHLANGGQRLVYVGEPPGGRSGDLRLHVALGLVDRCLACTYGINTVPCTCSVRERWQLRRGLPLPRWGDRDDELYLFAPRKAIPPRRWRR